MSEGNGIFLDKKEFTEESSGMATLETHTLERMVVKETKTTIRNAGNETKASNTTTELMFKLDKLFNESHLSGTILSSKNKFYLN